MVDVGYFINGKHGVIRNVIPMANTVTNHLTFANVANDEQYALKKENIEYVIPSDIDSMSGKIIFDKDGVTEYGEDGSVVMKGRYVENKNLLPPKPITFAEKFKEVFGFEPNINADMCDVVNCNCRDNCLRCPYEDSDYWDKPYVKAEVENANRWSN